MYSAKKVNGQKLYELARKNITIEREAVTVEIKELLLLSLFDHSIKFRVNCSKGTYIRQLGADIAVKLDTVGHLTELTRTTVGEYKLEDCVEFAQVEEQWMSTVI
jgi:tRNA pseudouridine55 synthase